jgi:excisionase family DNA binding protein
MRCAVDLRARTGPPLSTSQLARVAGLSDDTIRNEVAAGELIAFRTRGGHIRIYWHSARAWAVRIGIFHVRPTAETAETVTSSLHA